MKNKLKKWILVLVILFSLSLIFQSQVYRLKSKQEIPNHLKSELIKLGNIALKTKDVPVSAVLIYEDSIIGTGYNTVKKDKILSGHAEINALNAITEKPNSNVFQYVVSPNYLNFQLMELLFVHKPLNYIQFLKVFYSKHS